MLIALDTATRWAGIALYDNAQGLIAECGWHSANRHTVELMPAVAQMMARAGATPADLEAVAVALGPGSFTGLRVALAAAKGMALSLGIKLIGIPTLEVVAYPHRTAKLTVAAVVQAGRGRVCWATYAPAHSGRSSAPSYELSGVRELADKLPTPVIIAGELLPHDRKVLNDLLGERIQLPPPTVAIRRAGHLAEIAWTRFEAGDTDDLESLSPIYLHEPPRPTSMIEQR